jgi:hypothetical protein
MTANYSRIYWTVAGDLEDFSGDGAGYLDIYSGIGGITGLATLGNLFFAFQEKCYTVYQYQIGDTPLNYLKTVNHGCNFKRTIVEIENVLWYLSDIGEIRKTDGSTDVSISQRIKPITNQILNNRSIKDYYGSYPNTVPHAIYDKLNNAYRLFYAGTSSNVNKCLSYFIDRDIFTTASDVNYLTSTSSFGYESYIGAFGNSNANGNTYRFYTNYSATNKTGTIDLGWISSGDPKKQIKIHNVELWVHAEQGVSSNCNATFTVTVYKDPATNTSSGTYTTTIAYNSVVDNLQKKRIQTPTAYGDYVRLVLTDSGTTNYSIDKLILEVETVEGAK